MRTALHPKLAAGRVRHGEFGSDDSWGHSGAFFVRGPCGEELKIIASDCNGDNNDIAKGWEHVSISTRRRCPNWQEMCFVKDLFWDAEETVVQFHPPHSTYISNSAFRLHLFRDTRNGHALPPPILVGVREVGEIKTQAQAKACRDAVNAVLAKPRVSP